MVKICITNIDRIKLKTDLKTTEILENTWSTCCIELIISMLPKPEFVYSKINLVLEYNGKAKAKALFVYQDSIFAFIYDVKIIDLGKLFNPGVCTLSNFWPEIKVGLKL